MKETSRCVQPGTIQYEALGARVLIGFFDEASFAFYNSLLFFAQFQHPFGYLVGRYQ
jgi:hypothetical protein